MEGRSIAFAAIGLLALGKAARRTGALIRQLRLPAINSKPFDKRAKVKAQRKQAQRNRRPK